MACINFAVYEASDGWFVRGMHPIGPFYSQKQALELAESMVAAIRATGEQAVIVVEEPRTWAVRKTAPKSSARRAPPPGRPPHSRLDLGPSSPRNSG
jgi:hypothetical protein